MKKILVNAQIIAMLVLVPAIVIAYMHNDNKTSNKKETEIVRKGISISDAGSLFNLVKSY